MSPDHITESMDDFEAEQMLHALDTTGRVEDLQAACCHLLTAGHFPPRLGATYAAVQHLRRWPGVKAQLWEQVLHQAPTLSPVQLANFTSGHYYHPCTTAELDGFMKLATALPRAEDRRVIAVMLFTWQSYGCEEARVRQFIDAALSAPAA